MPDEEEPTSNPLMLPENVYNFLKPVALVLLPALSTLYFMLGQAWEWTNIEQVMATITAIDLFLGAILGISKRRYDNSDVRFDGVIQTEVSEDGNTVYSLVLQDAPEQLASKTAITFKVQ